MGGRRGPLAGESQGYLRSWGARRGPGTTQGTAPGRVHQTSPTKLPLKDPRLDMLRAGQPWGFHTSCCASQHLRPLTAPGPDPSPGHATEPAHIHRCAPTRPPRGPPHPPPCTPSSPRPPQGSSLRVACRLAFLLYLLAFAFIFRAVLRLKNPEMHKGTQTPHSPARPVHLLPALGEPQQRGQRLQVT